MIILHKEVKKFFFKGSNSGVILSSIRPGITGPYSPSLCFLHLLYNITFTEKKRIFQSLAVLRIESYLFKLLRHRIFKMGNYTDFDG